MSGGARGFETPVTYGLLHYNGFTFPTPITMRVETEPVPSEDERFNRYEKHTIHVEFILLSRDSPGGQEFSTTDVSMNGIRALLSESRGPLVIVNKGAGDGVINLTAANAVPVTTPFVSLSKRDLDNGPKPRVVAWEPVGGSRACRVTWECVAITLSQCNPLLDANNAPVLDFSYGLRWTVDEQGILTRITSGKIEIGVNADTELSGINANHARSLIYQYLPWLRHMAGITRNETFELTPDKKYLQFSITDQELPSDNPLYPRTIAMDVEHDTRGSLLGTGRGNKLDVGGFYSWPTSLRIEVTLAPGARRDVAYLAMISIFKDRIKEIRLSTKVSELPNGSKVTKDAFGIITGIRVTESLMTRRIFFNIEYTVFIRLSNVLASQRFFKRLDEYERFIPGPELEGTWEEWYAPLLNEGTDTDDLRFAVYGNMVGPPRRQNLVARDRQIANNICNKPPQVEITPEILNDVVPKQSPLPSLSNFEPIISPGKQSPGESWLHYENEYELEESTSTVNHTRIQQVNPNTLVSINQYSANPGLAGFESGWRIENLTSAPPASAESVIQVRGANRYVLHMRGFALRMGHSIPAPVIRSFGGQLAYRLPGSRWVHKQVNSSEDNPVYLGMWDVQYALPNAPTGQNLQAIQDTSGWRGAYV